jgi:hypothetical protein
VRKVVRKPVRRVVRKDIRKVVRKPVRRVRKIRVVRKVVRKPVRRVRRVVRKIVRKVVRKPVRRVVRKVLRKVVRKHVRRVRKVVRKVLEQIRILKTRVAKWLRKIKKTKIAKTFQTKIRKFIQNLRKLKEKYLNKISSALKKVIPRRGIRFTTKIVKKIIDEVDKLEKMKKVYYKYQEEEENEDEDELETTTETTGTETQKEKIARRTKQPELTQEKKELALQNFDSVYASQKDDSKTFAQLSKQQTNKQFLANFDAALCLCHETTGRFNDESCAATLKKCADNNECADTHVLYMPDGVKSCIKLWQQLNNGQAASLCPVDPSQANYANQAKATCGIPKHLDLYGDGFRSGMAFKLDSEMDAEKIKDIVINVETIGDGVDGVDAFKNFTKWTKGIQNNVRVNKGIVEWDGIIPKDIGKFIRDNCETLKWSVAMGGTSVSFDGLTFQPNMKSRRRKLLQTSLDSC